ncbi:MAG: glycosyltransferase family 1 protein [Lysobacterales bacterium]|nr:MAG: glycosyltransferase family 1 protein [Xanthomonadales bacterium]
MPVKIVHVNTARGYRGGERQTELLIRGLASRGVCQALVTRRGAPLAARLRDVAVEIREVAGGPLSVARAARDASLVHVHEGRSVYAAFLRSLLSGTPYVITRRVNNPIREHWFAHQAYRRAARVAAVAPQVAEIVRAYDAAIRLCVVHSGSSGLPVDPSKSAAIRASLEGKFVVGHVGALDNDQKGQEFIIAVARELAGSHPDVLFMLVGGGADEAMLKAAADGLPNVTFTGFVENVGDYLAAFDVFILPSNREGIGSILFDAMEQGLPVVASRVGGVPDIVHHEENGLLIDPASPAQLRDAILHLKANPDLCAAYGRRGKELAKDFTGEAMWRKYLALYESILGRLA